MRGGPLVCYATREGANYFWRNRGAGFQSLPAAGAGRRYYQCIINEIDRN